MGPPGITRHRRPFLAPLWVVLLAAVAIACVAFAFYRTATTTVVILAMSAEKQSGTIDDPPLSAEGEQRAQRLAQMFGAGAGPGRIDAVYVSDDRRAQQTAAPLLERLHLAAVHYNSQDAQAAASGLLRAHAGEDVLVVGGAADVRAFLEELAGTAPAATADNGQDLLYIVSAPSFGRVRLLQLKY
jgi:broad specificity phosphatase PhoE